LDGYASVDVGTAASDCDVAFDSVTNVGLGQEAVAAHGVETHQYRN